MKIIGWSTYDLNQFVGANSKDITDELINVIVEEVKNGGYFFTGQDHQDSYNCAPVTDDYKIVRLTRRSFAAIIAMSQGLPDSQYVHFTDYEMIDRKKVVFPSRGIKQFYDDKGKPLRSESKMVNVPYNVFEQIKKCFYDNCNDDYYRIIKNETCFVAAISDSSYNYYWIGDDVSIKTEDGRCLSDLKVKRILNIKSFEAFEDFISNIDNNFVYDEQYIKDMISKNLLILELC